MSRGGQGRVRRSFLAHLESGERERVPAGRSPVADRPQSADAPHPASVLETQRNNKRGQRGNPEHREPLPSRPNPSTASNKASTYRQPDCEGNRVPQNQILCVRTRGSERRGAVRAHWP